MDTSCSWMGRTLSSVGRQAIAAIQREPTSANHVETTCRPSLHSLSSQCDCDDDQRPQIIHQGRMNEPSVAERLDGVCIGIGPIRINDGFEC